MTLKTFKGKLILNVKSGGMRVVKRVTRGVSPYEMVVNITVEVDAPEPVVPSVELKVVVPRKQFNSLVMDSL